MGIGGIDFGRGNFDYSQRLRERSFDRLSSGKRINSAADDAANLATVQQFLAMEAAAAQGVQNLSDGQGALRTAEGALAGTSELLGRMRELTIQGQNGTLNDTDRAAIQQEYDQLSAEVTRISESTEFNGRQLLNGDSSGAGAIELHDGEGLSTRIEIAGHSAADLGIGGSISDPETLNRLDAAIDTVGATRGRLGAADNRISSQVRNLKTAAENTAAARSRIEDADIAAEASNLTRANILSESQVSLELQGRRLRSTSVLSLLG